MINLHENHAGSYNLLDTCSLPTATDKRIAILRHVSFRATKDSRPFIRASFEDVHGYIIIGRMFDFADFDTGGKAYTAMVGKLVLVSYTPDYYNGSMYLSISAIAAVDPTVSDVYERCFIGRYNLAEKRLEQCNQILASLSMTDKQRAFQHAYCNLEMLVSISDENISKGLRGYVLDIIYRVLLVSASVDTNSVLAFLCCLITWLHTRQNAETGWDDSNMMYTASMMDRRLDTAGCGLAVLSNKISEITALFINSAHVISSDTYLLFNTYRVLADASNVAVLESRLPPEGFCTYKNFTVRRS